MKNTLLFVCSCLLCVACASGPEAYTVSDTRSASGGTIIDLVCINSAGDYAACSETAGEACGGSGFEILHREDVMKRDQFGQYVKQRLMQVECKGR